MPPPAGDLPVVLITGATAGIGQATARLLAKSGCRVFGTGRHPASASVDGYELLPLDVTSDESVVACVKAVADATGGRIDVLINNVGTGILGAAEEATAGEVRALFEVNFFGAVRMTNAVLPFMRARRAGTIVTMSSAGGVAAVPFAAYYCATKFALEAWMEALRLELRPLGIAATVIAPGAVSTTAGDKAMRPARTIDAYSPTKDKLLDTYARGIRGGMDPAKVAAAILAVVRTKWPKPRYRVGGQSKAVSLLRTLLPTAWFQAGVRRAVGA